MYYYQPKNATVAITTPLNSVNRSVSAIKTPPDSINRSISTIKIPPAPVNSSVSTIKKPPAPVNRSLLTNCFDYNGIWITPPEYKFLPNPRITLK